MSTRQSLSIKIGVICLALGFTLCYVKAWGGDWKKFAEATTGIFHYDAMSIRSPSPGLIRVWIHNGSKHETSLLEFNCKTASYRVLDVIEYDESGRIKRRHDYYDNPHWLNISPKSVPEPLYGIVCR